MRLNFAKRFIRFLFMPVSLLGLIIFLTNYKEYKEVA
jgi:hypothetical protein